MSFTIPPILVYIASWFGMMGGVWALFDRAEKVVDPKVKEKISNWLLTAKVPVDERWPATFESMADKVFGRKLISWRSFKISILISIGSITCFFALLYYLNPKSFTWIFSDFPAYAVLIAFAMVAMILNFIQDYLSVIQTRFLLRKLTQNPILKKQLSFFLLDIFLTASIVCVTLFIFLKWSKPDFPIIYIHHSIFHSHTIQSWKAPYVYSTYLTSVWIWLYVMSRLAFKLVRKFSWSLNIAQRLLNIEERPLQSIGFISMLIVTLVYLIIPLVVDS